MKSNAWLLLIVLLIPAVAYAEMLEVSPLLLKTITKVNVAAEDSVTVMNLDVDTVGVKITTKSPAFKLSNYGFGLLPGEEKDLSFGFSSGMPGVFTNEFFIRAGESTVVLPVVVEVESASVRFDSTVETLDAKRVFNPGDDLAFSFTVFDLFEFVATDVEMEYYILNMENVLIHHEESSINVKAQKTQTRKIQLPFDIEIGNYVLVVRSRHGSSVGFSTLFFSVVEKSFVVEELTPKTFCIGLVRGCLNNGVCVGVVISVSFILFALLFIYIVEVVKLSRLPKRKIERAISQEEKRKEALSLAKKVLKEAEEQKKAKMQEKIEESERKKIIEEMLLKKRKRKPSIAEKKLFEREVKQAVKERKKVKKQEKKSKQNLIKEKRKELERRKKVEKMLKGKK